MPVGIMLDEQMPQKSRCIRCNTCDGFPCLVRAKADAHVVCVMPALEHPNVELLTNAYVARLETSASGREVPKVIVEHKGEHVAYSADVVVSSCGAINSAALLLRSANDKHPNGLANSSDMVGRMKLGDEAIELSEYLAPQGRPIPVDSHSNDRWFQHIAIIVNDMDRAYTWLRQHKVQHASTGPQRLPDWNPNAGGIQAFYFKDPDWHALEILQFPDGKGDPKWHRKSDKLFLGIDHTAIVVADTDTSLKFYRGILGLRIAGTSENYGTEQEHLNNVFGARLRITSLHAAEGPGIEFLEYLAPRDGRPYPDDAKANDLLHWQTKLVTHNTEARAQRVGLGEYKLLSPGTVTISSNHLGFHKAITVRDPDGHVIQIVEK
jgi:choline dehydrogenase-like flavoprotein